MQLVEWKASKPLRPPAADIAADWRRNFEHSAAAPNWLGAHKWNVDLRTMKAVADGVRDKLQLAETDRVLEVGCGTGALLSMILHPGQEGFGFDLCEALVRRGVNAEIDRDRIHCGTADAARLPLPSESFDKIICYAVFQCLSDEGTAMRVVRELVRVCKAGGIIFIGDVSGMLEKHRRVLSKIGMRDQSIETLLAAASPFWRLRRRWRHEIPPHLFVRRGMFRKAIEGLPCDLRFHTLGVRPDSRCRFDVCIHKDKAEVSRSNAVVVTSPESDEVHVPISVERFESFDELLPIRRQWDALAEDVGAELFASFDWCSTWWKHYQHGRQPEFFVARAAGEIVACLPFFRETIGYGPWRVNVIRLAGSCDAGTRCDLAVRPQFIDAVFREVTRRLDESGPWDVIHIGDLPGDFAHGRAVAHALQRGCGRGRVIYRTGYYPNSVFDIPGSYEDYLKQLSQNERSSIRRTERRLVDEHHARIRVTTIDELDTVFDQFHRQHEAWWAKSGHLGYFRDWPGSLDFHREFSEVQAREGRLHLLRLEAAGETIGFHYSHRFGKKIHWFSGSRSVDARWDPYSPGRQLHCATVREAVEHGVTQIDGLNGYYDFKKRWGARYNLLQNITVMSQDVL